MDDNDKIKYIVDAMDHYQPDERMTAIKKRIEGIVEEQKSKPITLEQARKQISKRVKK